LEHRKVLEMGGGTLLVSLPIEWARRNGVRKGATLALDELSGRKLVVRPIEDVEERPREIQVGYPGDDFSQVENDVTGAYLLGYDVIRIVGNRAISREDRAGLKAAMGRLVGLEIMDEDSKRMTVQFLLEASAIVPERIVRRMSGLLEGMLKDTAEGLAKADPGLLALVAERDDEVDRLYFLLVRATRAAIVRPEVAEGYGLSPVDLVDFRVLASFLESVGDAVTELSKRLLAGRRNRELSKEFAACVNMLREMNDLATQAFLSRKAGTPRSINARVNALAREVTENLAKVEQRQTTQGTALAETLGSLERVSKLLVDVSDLALIARPAA
jgi:phosphate uptake regulator